MSNLDNFKEKVSNLIYFLDDVDGFRLYKKLSREGLDKSNVLEEDDILSLKFLIIPFLEEEQIIDLFEEHLTIGLNIIDLDLKDRITKKLIMSNIDKRDAWRDKYKKALLKNTETITKTIEVRNGKKICTVSDWINNYLYSLDIADKNLGKARFFSESKDFGRLNQGEKIHIKKLLDLYDFLDKSSYTPLGFEDDILLKTEDGKLVTTDKGKVVVLYDFNINKSFQSRNIKARNVTGPPKTEGEKKIEKLEQEEENFVGDGIEKMVIREEIDKEKKIEDLKIMVNKFKEGSLERKVMEEEIKKLEEE